MLRKTLVTLTAVAALGVGSAAMAAHGGGGGGGGGGGHGGGFGGSGGFGGGGGFAGAAHGFGGGGGFAGGGWHGGSAGPMMMRGGPMASAPTVGGRSATVTAPMAGGRVQGWSRNAWVHDHFHDHFHDRFHHRFHNRFFAFGFGGPIYDYAYGSCWSWVPTRYGWQWVYVCGDYYY
jgi:hypothetical protein